MPRKSSIKRLPSDVQSHIHKLLREDRLTLDELIADLQTTFPQLAQAKSLPSRSAIGRHSQAIKEIVKSEREMAAAAEALVAELGENFDQKSGALLAQAVTTLASRRAMQALQADDTEVMEISDVLDLARAAKVAQEARSLNLKERHAVAADARQKLLEQQRAALESMGTKGGVTEETKIAIRQALGIV